ncbi:MAG: hypothetical protein WA632_13410 [Gallionella sp.]
MKNRIIAFLGCLLAGCAQASLDDVTAAERVSDQLQNAYRAVIYFSGIQGADRTQLSAAIARACRCQPVYLRPYAVDALIYRVELPPGSGFPAFQYELMKSSEELGITAVEPDNPMRPQ